MEAELRRLARYYLRGERDGHTLQTTGLVNEAWMQLLEGGQVHWQNRAHFIGLAATTMQHILVDWARAQRYQKRGSGAVQVSLGDVDISQTKPLADIVAVHEAMERLAAFNANAAFVVEWCFFGGFQNKEIAEALGISEAAATRYWHFAQAWLKRELTRQEARAMENNVELPFIEPDRGARLIELFDQARRLPVGARAAFVTEACGQDEALRRELESLLEHTGSDLPTSGIRLAARHFATDERQDWSGRQINQYRLLSVLGEGGMGKVYLAEDERLARRVALKFLPGSF